MLKGDLTSTPLAPLLLELAEGGATGCLVINDPKADEALVYLKSGLIYAVSVPGTRPQLGAKLVSSGALAPEALSEALEAQRTELQGWRLGELLVHLGYVDQPLVEAFVKEQVNEALWDLLRWNDGTWKFRKNIKAREDVGPPMTVVELLETLRDRGYEWEAISAIVHGPDAIPRLSTRNDSQQETTLDNDAWSVLCKIDGERTVADLARDCGYTLFEAGLIMVSLVETGLVDIDEDLEMAAGNEPYGASTLSSAFAGDLFDIQRPEDEYDDGSVDGDEDEDSLSRVARLVSEVTREHADIDASVEAAAKMPIETPTRPALSVVPDLDELGVPIVVQLRRQSNESFAASIARVSSALSEVLGDAPEDAHHPVASKPVRRTSPSDTSDPEWQRRKRLRQAAADELASAQAMIETLRPGSTADDTPFSGEVPKVVSRATEERRAAERAMLAAQELTAREIANRQAETAAAEAHRIAAEAEAQRLAAEATAAEAAAQLLLAEAETQRLAAEEAERRTAAAEAERVAVDQAEQDALAEDAAIAAAEDAAIAAAEAEALRLREEAAERKRLLAETAEQRRLDAEADAARVAAEAVERQRLAAETAAAAEEERARLAVEEAKQREAEAAAEEAARIAEAALATQIAAEEAAAAEAEAARIATEEAARQAAEEAEQKRVEAEEAERARLAAEEAARLAAEQAEAERLAAEQAEAERLAAEQAEAERAAAEEAERLAAEAARLAAEQAEAERLVAEEAERARLAVEEAEAARLAAEEADRIAAEEAEQTRLAAEEAERERIEAEEAARAKAAADAERARMAAEAEAQRQAEQAAAEQTAAEEAERQRLAAEQAAAEQAEAERLAAEQAAAEEAERQRIAAEQAAAEQAAADAEAQRQAAEANAVAVAAAAEREATAEAERIALEDADQAAMEEAERAARRTSEKAEADAAAEREDEAHSAAAMLVELAATSELPSEAPHELGEDDATAEYDDDDEDDVPSDAPWNEAAQADTAALLRELSSLGGESEGAAAPPTTTRAPRTQAEKGDKKAKKKIGLFGL